MNKFRTIISIIIVLSLALIMFSFIVDEEEKIFRNNAAINNAAINRVMLENETKDNN